MMSKHGNKKQFWFRTTVTWILVVLILLSMPGFLAGCRHPVSPSKSSQDGPADSDASLEVFGRLTEYSTYKAGELLKDTFYCNDAWFGDDPAKRNDALALLSMQLTAAAVTSEENGSGALALRKLGFDRLGFVGFGTDDSDDCAYTWATKKIGDKTLVAIVFQSYALDSATKVKAWKQNFHVNDEDAFGEHAAFKKASEKVLDGIASLGGENARFWIMGQSRGGALANLVAAKLSDKLGGANGRIYAYTFEAPATVDGALAQTKAAEFAYIHNYIASDDMVPLVPMWGMTRYGNQYEVKSDATEQALSDELQIIGSSAAGVEFGSNEDKIVSLVEYLENRVSSGTPSREDYSKVRLDTYKDSNGNTATVEYSYQETMEHLMNMIFSGEFAGIEIEKITEDLSIFSSAVYSLADAVKGETREDEITVNTYYYQAAENIHSIVNGMVSGEGVSLDDTDFYALLRLAGPRMVDADYEPEGDPKSDVAGYIYPVIELAQSFGNLGYAHHFDTVIARLKTLAPQPNATSLALSLAQPKAGDASSRMPEAFLEGIRGLDASWISVRQAGWNAEGSTLQNGSIYYFEATVEIVGHRVPDDFKITINGQDPIDVTSSYEDGVCVVKIRWEFVIGTPEKVSLTFIPGHGAKAPATLSVDKGKLLKYVEKPSFTESISEDGTTYLFDQWRSEDGKDWDAVTASHDTVLSAHWILVIDEVRIIFPIPSVGGEVVPPSVAEDAPYRLKEYNIMNEDYKFVEIEDMTKQAGKYDITLFFQAIEGESVFATEMVSYEDDYVEAVYTGTVQWNGEPQEDYYYDGWGEPALFSVYLTLTVE